MCDAFGHFSDRRLPPGCRAADLEREASMLDDLSPAQLWRLLTDVQQARLYRDFFHAEWGELSAYLAEPAESAGGPGDSALLTMPKTIGDLWLRWRDRAVLRMLRAGEIQIGR